MTNKVPESGSMAGASASRGAKQTGVRGLFARASTEAMLLVFLVALLIFLGTQSEYFLTVGNLRNIGLALSVLAVLAFPSTMLIISGNFDLSVASNAAFTGMLFAVVTNGGKDQVMLGVLVALLGGLMIGVFNGFLVTVVRVNSLITTLGTLAIFRGLAKILSNGQTLRVQGFRFMGQGEWFGIPIAFYIVAAVAIIVWFILRNTVYGRNLYAIGSNATAARLVGIRNNATIFATFALTGFLGGVAGLMLTSELTAASPIAGLGLELSVVSAVVLGGASLAGGRGTVLGTILGLLILTCVNNGMTLAGLSSFWQEVARGVILIAAVAFDQLRIRVGGK